MLMSIHNFAIVPLLLSCIGLRVVAADELGLMDVPIDGKLEVVAPVESVAEDGSSLLILGYQILLTQKTRYENRAKIEIPRFDIVAGQWLKVKANRNAQDVLIARKVRQIDKRPVLISVTRNVDTGFADVDGKALHAPLREFLEDESKGVGFKIPLTDALSLGGKLETTVRAEQDRDLDVNKLKDRTVYTGSLRLDLLWKPVGGRSFALLESQFDQRVESHQQAQTENTSTSRLSRAYLFLTLNDRWAVNVGRQDFDDPRQWLYDEVLDGLRLYVFGDEMQLALSASTGREFLAQENKHQDINNYIADLRYMTGKHGLLGAWLVARRDTTIRNFSPVVYGVRALAYPNVGLRHWLEISQSRGEDGEYAIEGFAMDVGFSYIFDIKTRPYVIAGMAYASGRKDSDVQNGAYRQTGLQDNADKFGGVTRYRYYGEVMDPELSNKFIASVGLGIRPIPSVSLDVVAHAYRQVEKSVDLGDTRIKANPNGLSTDLGSEIDIVIGHRVPDVAVEVVLGRFEPGAAFNKQDPSFLGKFQLEYKF